VRVNKQKMGSVPPPWTPMICQRTGESIEIGVWGRSHTFVAGPLPAAISVHGSNILAAPIRLRGGAAAVEAAILGASDVAVLGTAPDHVLLNGGWNLPGFWASMNVRLEFDGMIRFDLVLAPHVSFSAPGVGPDLSQLWVEIPLRPEWATLFTYWPVKPGGVVQANKALNSGALPKKGFKLPFKPFLWLGNEDGGLSWFAESDERWQPGDPESAIEVIPEPGVVLLRIRLLDSPPAEWAGKTDWWGAALPPQTFTFGLQATPIKSLPQDSHGWRFAQLDYGSPLPSYRIEQAAMEEQSRETVLDRIVARGVRTACLHEKWTPIQNYWRTDAAAEIKATVKACHARGLRVIPYLGYEISTRAPEWAELADRVVLKDADGNWQGGWERNPIQRDYMVCYRSEWQDRWLDGLAGMLDEYGFDGVYLDGTTMPWGCANAAHGCGYMRADGKRALTYPVFAVRRLMQRLYEIVHTRGGLVTAHQSSCCITPILSFCHSYWDGEHIAGSVETGGGMEATLATFRAEFMGRNFGVPCEFLATKKMEMLALTILHNVTIRPGFRATLDAVAPVWRALENFGVGKADWHPYWRNHELIESGACALKMSYYTRPGRLLLVIANLDSSQQAAGKVLLDRIATPGFANATARDVLGGQELAVERGWLSTKVLPMSFRLIEVCMQGKQRATRR